VKSKNNETVVITIGFIVDGNTKRDIVEWLSKNAPDCDADATYDQAIKSIVDSYRDQRGSTPAIVYSALRELHRRAVEIGDIKTAADILVKIEKIYQNNS
jgi:hypothetical protein